MGSAIDIQIRGYNRVRNELRPLLVSDASFFDPLIERWVKRQRLVLKRTPYPPPPPKSKYVRTGNLANKWAVVQHAEAIYSIVNEAVSPAGVNYAGYVVGNDEEQAWMHVGRWWQAREIIENNMPSLRELIYSTVDKL